MAKIHVVGASVGAAVARCIEKIVPQLPKYRSVENHCKSGAKYFGLKWPHPSKLSREDVLIIFPCGQRDSTRCSGQILDSQSPHL